MDKFLSILPLIVILGLLFLRKHMLLAGIVGGVLTMLIGGIGIDKFSGIFIDSMKNMLGITVPILYAAAAAMVSKAGSIQSLVELSNRLLRGRLSILAGIIVLIQGLATYMAGTGAGNTMVTAPLVATAVGFVPEVVAAIAIVSAVGFTTSPASTETVLTAESAGVDVVSHSVNMMPYTILFYGLAIALAIYGAYKKGALIKNADEKSKEDLSVLELLKRSIPSISLLLMVVLGTKINGLFGIVIITPATAVILTTILTVICTPFNVDKTCDALIEGSQFILTTLFAVGIFLSFINMMSELGTFKNIASLANYVPESIVLPVAIILAFLIAIPSGAFAAGVLTLTLPTLALLGLPSQAMGFVAIATGLGTQLSPVQINVSALSKGFETDIITIIKCNLKYILISLAIVIALAMITV